MKKGREPTSDGAGVRSVAGVFHREEPRVRWIRGLVRTSAVVAVATGVERGIPHSWPIHHSSASSSDSPSPATSR